MTDEDTSAADAVEPESTAVDESDTASAPAEESTAQHLWDPKAGGIARIVAFGVLPAIVLILAIAAGYLAYVGYSASTEDEARQESMQAAKDGAIAMLSYTPDKVEQQVDAAGDLLTGEFRDSYAKWTHDVVIPGAKLKQISAVATVPGAASVSAEADRAVVLVFVNQTVAVGQNAPTDTPTSVRVTLERLGGVWKISGFDPV
jgi:Mce-associated membrane protein